MAWELLPTDYTDATWEGDLKYKQKTNADGTVSFEDVTEYTNLEKCFFGAKDANRIDEAINAIMAALEDGTDLYEVFLEFFGEQEKLFEEASDEQRAANQADFLEWFETIKDQLSEDAAGKLELQIQDLTRQVNYDFSGFRNTHTAFNADGSITQEMSNTLGEAFTQNTVFNADGSITETLTAGDVTIATKTTVFNEDGSIDETIEEG